MKRSIPGPAMAVALVALFMAMGGSAYAGAKLSKNSVTNKTIKNNAVTGKKVKNGSITGADIKADSLTGAQISEATLGKVGDAETVDGIDSTGFAPAKSALTWNVPMNRGDAPRVLGKFGPFTFTGRCEVAGADSSAYVDVTTSVDNVYSYNDSDLDVGETDQWVSYTNFMSNARNYASDESYFFDPASGASVLDGDGQSAGVWVGFPGADCRFVANMPIALP